METVALLLLEQECERTDVIGQRYHAGGELVKRRLILHAQKGHMLLGGQLRLTVECPHSPPLSFGHWGRDLRAADSSLTCP